MSARVIIEHNSQGWINVFKSAGMQAAVDAAGNKIAAAAGEHFYYHQATNNRFTAAGFVDGDKTGSIQEAEDKMLTRAVHK